MYIICVNSHLINFLIYILTITVMLISLYREKLGYIFKSKTIHKI